MSTREEELKKVTQEVHSVIEKLGDSIPPQRRPMIEEAISKMMVDNKLPKDVLGFSPEIMEMIYQHGYNLFQNGKYQDALNVFNILRQLDNSSPRYTFAIAACHHYAKEYLDAAANYSIYKYMDPLNPIPSFHLYDCYMKTDHTMSALLAIQEALVLAERSPEYAGLKEKIQLEFEHLKNVLKSQLTQKYEASA
jgi:type III secretion system low calcium response chaperone LcrH/SycD